MMYGFDVEFVAVVYLTLMALLGVAAFAEWLASRRD